MSDWHDDEGFYEALAIEAEERAEADYQNEMAITERLQDLEDWEAGRRDD